MSPTAPATRTVRAGIERLLDDDRGLVAGSRVALVSNPASVDRSLRHSADRPPGRSRHRPGRALRPAARVPFRSAGQHDRDAARPGCAPADPDLLALQRDARTDRRDAARRRRAAHRSAGRRHARLHLHLHDGQLHARRRAARRPRRRLRSSEPGRRCRRGRGDTAAGVRVVRRTVPDPAASRPHHRRDRPSLQPGIRHRRRARHRPARRLDA